VVITSPTPSAGSSRCFEGESRAYSYSENGIKNNLFAKIYGCKQWDNTTGAYENCSSDIINGFDITSGAGDPPQVDKITIGGQTGIIPKDGSYEANLEFYAWADKNHMPIREIGIDWVGDKNDVRSFPVFVKNHKEKCSESNDGASEFALAPDACTTEPWSFGYTFYCGGEGSPGWNSDFCSAAGISNACCFQPTIYVKDNWGWCNGGKYAGDNECYLTDGAGAAYNGVIVVRP